MTKQKQPLLSLEAHGSLADFITFQTRGPLDIARKKPRLPYFLTLPVQYQRWLYQDHAYLWTQQSAATQKAYRAAGVHHHLTGFQYWMKDMLTRLPYLAGYWKLDDNHGPTLQDSSRNTNTGTITGASPAEGPIAGGLSFDGLNDLVSFGNHASLDFINDSFTIELWLKHPPRPQLQHVLNKLTVAALPGWTFRVPSNGKHEFLVFDGAAASILTSAAAYHDDEWHHVVAIRDRPNNRLLMANDGQWETSLADPTGSISNTRNLYLATRDATDRWFLGQADHLTLWNIAFPYASTHSNRRYPPQ